MGLIAKPILKDKLWIVSENGIKVGNVVFTNDEYKLSCLGKKINFKTTTDIENIIDIHFLKPTNKNSINENISYAKWPTSGKTFNNVYDLKNKLHLFTKTKKSKSMHAAGWFSVKINGTWKVLFCPKYIYISRYKFHGPYLTEAEAIEHFDKYHIV